MKKTVLGALGNIFLAAGLFSTILISCKEKDADIVKNKAVTDIINENSEFSIFKTIVERAESSDALRSQNATFFLPDNVAFQNAKISSSAAAGMSKTQAGQFLNSFVIKSFYDVDKDLPNDSLKTVSGKKIKFVKQDGAVNVNNAEIVKKNIPVANNGIIRSSTAYM